MTIGEINSFINKLNEIALPDFLDYYVIVNGDLLVYPVLTLDEDRGVLVFLSLIRKQLLYTSFKEISSLKIVHRDSLSFVPLVVQPNSMKS